LIKSRNIAELLDLVIKIVTDVVVLRKKIEDVQEWQTDQPTCSERQDLVQKSLIHALDVLNSSKSKKSVESSLGMAESQHNNSL